VPAAEATASPEFACTEHVVAVGSDADGVDDGQGQRGAPDAVAMADGCADESVPCARVPGKASASAKVSLLRDEYGAGLAFLAGAVIDGS
jgi:hypothetical protein